MAKNDAVVTDEQLRETITKSLHTMAREELKIMFFLSYGLRASKETVTLVTGAALCIRHLYERGIVRIPAAQEIFKALYQEEAKERDSSSRAMEE